MKILEKLEKTKEKEARGIKLSYMHILIAGVVRMIALRPQLNRFIMNGKIYMRHKIYVSFVVHPRLCDGDIETTIKLEFEGTETIQEIVETINCRIKEETTAREGENGTDKRMGWGLVSDERFCDGLYFALSLRQLRKFMRNPRLLEEPLEAKVEDVP